MHRDAVVFLDLGLPYVDGFDVARTIRGAQELEPPLVVAVTGQGYESRSGLEPLGKGCT